METKFKLLLAVVFLTGNWKLRTENCFSQDIHFSQFNMAPLIQNPAMVAANYDIEAIMNYKDQWRSVGSPYKTGNLSYDMKLGKNGASKGFWGAGINIFNDKAGDSQMKTTMANISLAYHVKLNVKNTLGGGLMAGFGQRSVNYEALQWMSQYDGTSYNAALPNAETKGSTSFTYSDIAGGLVWRYRADETQSDLLKANLGLSVFHPHQPHYSFDDTDEKLKIKSVAHGNLNYKFKNTNTSVIPDFAFYLQGTTKELVVGSFVRYALKEESRYTDFTKGAAFSLGVHYRNKDALILSYLLEMGQYALGISYDVNVSGLKAVTNARGGIEFSLRFVTPTPFVRSKSNARF